MSAQELEKKSAATDALLASAQRTIDDIEQQLHITVAKIGEQDPGFYERYIAEQWPALIVNAIRDFVWAYTSYELYNDRLKRSSNEDYSYDSEQFGQLIYSGLAMLVPCLIASVYYAIKVNRGVSAPLKERLASFKEGALPWYTATLAAWLPIYSWDWGQQVGLKLFGGPGKNPIVAGCLAGIFTGLGEGWVQWLSNVLTGLKNLANRSKWQQQPGKTSVEHLGQLLFSLGPGSIPGGMWQVAWVLAKVANFGSVGTSALVSFTVFSSNMIYGVASNKAFSSLDKLLTGCFGSPTHAASAAAAKAGYREIPDAVLNKGSDDDSDHDADGQTHKGTPAA